MAYHFGGALKGGLLSRQVHRQSLAAAKLEWDSLSVGGGPARKLAHAWFDERRGRLTVLGGFDSVSAVKRDVWTFDPDAGSWVERTPAATGPTTIRQECPMAYDSRADRLLYLEQAGGGTVQLWELDVASEPFEWQPVSTSGSLPNLTWAAAAYDSLADRLFVLAAVDSNSLWSLDRGTGAWSQASLSSNIPLRTTQPKIVFDEQENRLFVHGPTTATANTALLELDGSPAWQAFPGPRGDWDRVPLPWVGDSRTGELHIVKPIYLVTLTSRPTLALSSIRDLGRPLAHAGMAGAIDAVGRAWYVYGGTSSWPQDCGAVGATCLSGRVFRIDLDHLTSEEIHPTGIAPDPPQGHHAVWDPTGPRILVGGGSLLPDLWAIELGGTPHWAQVPLAAGGPAQGWSAMALDETGPFLYVLEPWSGGPPTGALWRLDLSVQPAAWSRLLTGVPFHWPGLGGFDQPSKTFVAANPKQGVTIACQAASTVVGAFEWYQNRQETMMAYDARRVGVHLHDGWYGVSNTGLHAPWNTIFYRGDGVVDYGAQNTHDTPYAQALAVHDPALDRMLLLNGLYDGGRGTSTDFWELQLDGITPTRLDLVEATVDGSEVRIRFAGEGLAGELEVDRSSSEDAAWQPLGAAHLVSPGRFEYVDRTARAGSSYRYRGRYRDQAGEHLTAESDLVAVASPTPKLGLALRGGTLVRTETLEFDVSLVASAPATLEVIDVAGRRLVAMDLPGGTGGPRLVRVSASTRLPRGVLFVRLRQGDETAGCRVVRL